MRAGWDSFVPSCPRHHWRVNCSIFVQLDSTYSIYTLDLRLISEQPRPGTSQGGRRLRWERGTLVRGRQTDATPRGEHAPWNLTRALSDIFSLVHKRNDISTGLHRSGIFSTGLNCSGTPSAGLDHSGIFSTSLNCSGTPQALSWPRLQWHLISWLRP